MAKDRLSGKLAVILHADVAGSTALVQQDEQLAHDRIQETFHRFGDTIAKYQGHVRELRGDALLAEFERASDAVIAALAFQADQIHYNTQLNDSIQPTVRVGIAMGEVIIADDTITGVGVVLAQRLEQLSEPGGLVIQGAAYETIPGRFPFEYVNLGEHEVKGFDEPVRAYSASLKPDTHIPQPGPLVHRTRNKIIAVASIAVIIAGITLMWVKPWEIREEPASLERMAFPLPDRPSIAVLPFVNMSNDKEQEYFVDGMTEDLITDLSNLPGLFVIARNSVFTYKGISVKIRQVAEELGVRYVLEGSVRRVGDQIRINAQLIDATTGGHLWAKRYDGLLDDVFELQDEVTQSIVTALAVSLVEESGNQDRNETDNLEAYDAFLRGWAHYQLDTRDDFAKAVPYYEKAIALDPNYGRAHAALAAVYWDSWDSEWVRSLGISFQEATEKAQYHLQEAMNNPTPLAHRVSSKILTWQNRWDEAIAAAENAIALDAGNPSGYEAMARVLSKVGKHAEALDFIEKAIRLDPQSDYLYRMGVIQYHLQRYEEAGATMLRATRRNPDDDFNFLLLAATYGHLGREQEARSAIETFNELRANAGRGAYTLAHINEWTYKEEAEKEQLREGLRKAGLPEGSPVVAITPGGTSPKKVEGAITIDATRAKTLFDRAVPFVDVRDDADWNAGHIPDAVHLELFNVFSEARLSKIVGKNEEVVFHCAGPSCGRSAGACVSAVSWGFTRVYYFRDGFPAWKAAGYPSKMP